MKNMAPSDRVSESVLFIPGNQPRELTPAINQQDIIRDDIVPPATPMFENPRVDLGTAPLDTARYISIGFHNLEVAKLWPRVWQFAASTYDLPNPGDVSVYRNVGQSVAIVRQRDGSLKAFVNSCLHRGREVCNSDGHHAQLRCPYHGFTWTLEGALKWVPSEWDFPQVMGNPSKFSLPQVRVEEWNSFIFINFDESAPSLQEYMGGMRKQWDAGSDSWNFHKRYKAVHVEKLINANWKVCMEAFMEALHVFASHNQMADYVNETSTQYDVWPNEPHFSRFHNTAGFPSSAMTRKPTEQEIVDGFAKTYLPNVYNTDVAKLLPGETARRAFTRCLRLEMEKTFGVDLSSTPDCEITDGIEYSLFPNFLPWPCLGNPIVYRFRPADGPDWSIWETMIFLPFQGERPVAPPIIKLGADESVGDVKDLGFLAEVLFQDEQQIPLVQRGLKANRAGHLNLAKYQEARIRHYNQTLDSYLARR